MVQLAIDQTQTSVAADGLSFHFPFHYNRKIWFMVAFHQLRIVGIKHGAPRISQVDCFHLEPLLKFSERIPQEGLSLK